MNKDFWSGKKIIVTGAYGFLGAHLMNALRGLDCSIFPVPSDIYDLRRDYAIGAMFSHSSNVDIFINLAANVGGIGYNRNHPYQLFYDNALMGIRLIDAAIKNNVKKFVQVGTVCSYPKFCPMPFSEHSFWDGYPEESNAPYGLAKKMLLAQLQAARQEFDFNGIYLVPTNLYGPGDNFDPDESHVVPALIRKFLYAEMRNVSTVNVWGAGKASRDFLYVKDAINAIILAIEKYNRPEPINIGSGNEIRISTLVQILGELINYQGQVSWKTNMPDGQPRRVLNINHAKDCLGWKAETKLKDGLKETIDWYKKEVLEIA